MNQSFWANKKVLVTGHTGFKGSWLSLWLQQLGAKVIGYALAPPTTPSLFDLAAVAEGMTSIERDIRDLSNLKEVLGTHQPEIIIHMAAQPLVRDSYTDPVTTYATNVMGTVNLFESIRQNPGIRVVVNVTTDKCYENQEWVWGYRENEPMGGFDPYSNSKGCSELVTSAFRNSFFHHDTYQDHGVAIATARAGNVIGGGDWARDRLIPDCIQSWLKEEKVCIRYPLAIRPWQHVLEPLSGYLLLAEKLYKQGPQYGEAWNFGPEEVDAKSVETVVAKLASYWGRKAIWEVDSSVQPHEANYLKLDCSKAKMQLGWKPRWNLDTALQKIAEWYEIFQHEEHSLKEKTCKQIQEFEELQ